MLIIIFNGQVLSKIKIKYTYHKPVKISGHIKKQRAQSSEFSTSLIRRLEQIQVLLLNIRKLLFAFSIIRCNHTRFTPWISTNLIGRWTVFTAGTCRYWCICWTIISCTWLSCWAFSFGNFNFQVEKIIHFISLLSSSYCFTLKKCQKMIKRNPTSWQKVYPLACINN